MKFLTLLKSNKVLLFASIIIISYILTFMNLVPDRDLWARLAVGSLFFQTGGVLNHDIFAYTQTKALWIDHEWGSGVIFYFITSHFGDLGLIAFKFLLLFATFYLMSKVIETQQGKISEKPIQPLFWGLLAFSVFPIVINTIRSQSFTILFFALWLFVLEKMRKGENKLWWIIPATMPIWANVHGGFAAGYGLLAIYALGEFINKKNPVKYILMLLGCVALTLINPYGFEYLKYVAEAATMHRVNIFEWQALNIGGPYINMWGVQVHIFTGFALVALLTLVTALKSVKDKANYDAVKIILLAATFINAVIHMRMTIFFVICAFCFLYPNFIALFKPLTEKISEKVREKLVYANWGFLVISCFMFLPAFAVKTNVNPYFYPINSLNFMQDNHLKGNLAVPYGWGSYAFWKLFPDNLISVDGRYEETYPNETFDMAAKFLDHNNDSWKMNLRNMPEVPPPDGWTEFLKTYHTDIIIAPKYAYTNSDIEELSGWFIAYEDPISYVLLPKKLEDRVFSYPDAGRENYFWEDLSKPVRMK